MHSYFFFINKIIKQASSTFVRQYKQSTVRHGMGDCNDDKLILELND